MYALSAMAAPQVTTPLRCSVCAPQQHAARSCRPVSNPVLTGLLVGAAGGGAVVYSGGADRKLFGFDLQVPPMHTAVCAAMCTQHGGATATPSPRPLMFLFGVSLCLYGFLQTNVAAAPAVPTHLFVCENHCRQRCRERQRTRVGWECQTLAGARVKAVKIKPLLEADSALSVA